MQHRADGSAAFGHVSIVSNEILSEQLESLAPGTRIVVHPVFSNLGEPVFSSAQLVTEIHIAGSFAEGTELIERSLRSFLETAEFNR